MPYALYPDDERNTAAQIRALLMQGHVEDALATGARATERFPTSVHIWLTYANAQIVAKQYLSFDSVPVAFHNDADALQMLAQSAEAAGDLEAALRWSQKSLQALGVAFFARSAALRIVVSFAMRFPYGARFGAAPKHVVNALRLAAHQFENRNEALWSIQSSSADEAACHLGFAYLLLDQATMALRVAQEAATFSHRSPQLLHMEVTALSELTRDEDLLHLFETRLAELLPESLVLIGQLAARNGDVELLERALARARTMDHPDGDAVDALNALMWEVLAQTGQGEVAHSAIVSAAVASQGSLTQCCVAARVLTRLGRSNLAETIMARARAHVSSDSSAVDKLMLAELLFGMKRWSSAGELFEQLTEPKRISELTNRLLACHIRGHNRASAKKLLAELPAEWIENDETRHLAIELGQEARDWAFLKPLADAQLRRHPQSAGAWLLKLHVSLRGSTPPEFQDDLRKAPAELTGGIASLTQVARLEMHYGEPRRALRRLYKMARTNLDSPEALSEYFLSFAGARAKLPGMEAELPEVAPGTSVTVQDDSGRIFHVVIDPEGIDGLELRDGFFAPASPQAQALIGTVKNQVVSVPMLAFGDERTFTVIAIQSAYRRLLAIADERSASIAGLPNIKNFATRSHESDEPDLTDMRREVRRAAEHSRTIFQHYAEGHLTLAGFTRLHGRQTLEAVLGWPADELSMFVTGGTDAERQAAANLLLRTDASYVIDAVTLAELTILQKLPVLKALPRLYVSALTRSIISDKHQDALNDRSVATSTEINGELHFFEHTDAMRRKRIEFYETMLKALETYCIVEPAYGDPPDDEDVSKAIEVMQPEELEVLLLARGKGATVLTLDGKFRQLLGQAKVDGVWPQLLFWHAAGLELINPAELAEANVRQFLGNRSFISLSPADLIWMTHQGGSWLQLGLQRLKVYSSSASCEFKSTAGVVFNFLQGLALSNTQLKAFSVVFELLIEALLRHPDLPADFEDTASTFIVELAHRCVGRRESLDLVRAHQDEKVDGLCTVLARSYVTALERAKGPVEDPVLNLEVLFCSKHPHLRVRAEAPRP